MDEDIHRRVAIKRLREDVVSAAMLLRFADEVRTIGQLEHPGIVPVHDVGIDENGKHYLVMKYVEGETLETVLERLRAGDADAQRRFGLSQRLDILTKILEALSYAHEEGFIHRDLKPSNVMVGSYGEVTLMDWGIAKPIGSADPEPVDELAATGARAERLIETQAGSILGTPLYMAPEQAAGQNEELDARADIFALGLLAIELFTLRHPFEKLRTTTAIVASLLHRELDAWKVLMPLFAEAGAPMDILWFSARAVRKDPADRYADAGEMLAELGRVRSRAAAPQCHVTAAKAVLAGADRWLDRHPRAFTVSLVMASIGALGALGAGLWWLIG